MLQLFQSLGRLSVRGYLVIAGLVAITILLNYSNWQNQLQIAARQAQKHTSARAGNETLTLSETDTATKANSAAAPTDNTASTPAPSTTPAAAAHGGAVQSARTLNGGTLVFSPANITLSLSGKSPLVTVSSSDGAKITVPEITSAGGGLTLVTQKTTTNLSPSWQLQLTGQHVAGTYKLTLHANSDTGDYVGTLTVLVIL
ncbi:MAG: hypothetical protein ABIR37_03410 [Candidatus Saccharimonadales bacterium]